MLVGSSEWARQKTHFDFRYFWAEIQAILSASGTCSREGEESYDCNSAATVINKLFVKLFLRRDKFIEDFMKIKMNKWVVI